MPKPHKGWMRGLAEGYEVSGAVLGALVPITLALLLLFGGIAGFNYCASSVKDKGPCTDYSYDKGLFGSDNAVCNKWPNMSMKIETRFIKSDIVHCKCPAVQPEQNE